MAKSLSVQRRLAAALVRETNGFRRHTDRTDRFAECARRAGLSLHLQRVVRDKPSLPGDYRFIEPVPGSSSVTVKLTDGTTVYEDDSL